MHAIPQRLSLAGQIVAYIHGGIAAGRWSEWLPPERRLAETLQVSRPTLRRALAELQREGTIRAARGKGNRIMRRDPRPRGRLRSRDVGILATVPLGRLRPNQALWIDELRTMRDDDPFLAFLVPEVARYVVSPRVFARSLLPQVLELLQNGAVSSRRAVRLMPRFVRGASIGAM